VFVFSQRLITHFWSLCRLLFFVSGGGVELFQTALQTHTIDRSVLSSLLIRFARPIAFQGGATGLSRVFVLLAELVPLQNLVV